MFNLVILSGRLTADAELKTTQNGISVTSFNIAVNRPKKDEEQLTDFINIVAWQNTAEFVTKYFKKGSLIGVEGSIRTRKYEDRDGNKRTVFEVIANQVHFLESKRNGDNISERQDTNTGDFADIGTDEDVPF